MVAEAIAARPYNECMLKLSLLLFIPALLAAQTVQAIGTYSLAVTPDQVSLDIGVTTQGNTAQEAAQSNSTLATTVQNAIKQLLGSNGSVQTVSYYISPRYSTVSGQPSVIVGYTATNTVRATTSDLSIPGRLIDTANQAGATNISSLTFSLQNSEPAKQTALTAAAKQAMEHAKAIASGFGARIGAVRAAQEGATVTPLTTDIKVAAPTTPIQTGNVTVTASVTLSVQLQQ